MSNRAGGLTGDWERAKISTEVVTAQDFFSVNDHGCNLARS